MLRPSNFSCKRLRDLLAQCSRAESTAEHGAATAGYVAENWKREQQTGLYLGEDEARYFFRQFITAVAFCHAHSVAHRWAPTLHAQPSISFPGRSASWMPSGCRAC